MTDPVPATMMDPALEVLLDKVEGSKFMLVTLTAKRARQLNSYFSELGGGLGQMVPPQVVTSSQKPVSIALAEIAENRIVPLYPTDVDIDGEEAALAVAHEADAAASNEPPADAGEAAVAPIPTV